MMAMLENIIMMKSYNKNNLITEIKKSINEELGISKMVTNETNSLISTIINDSKKQPKQNNMKNGLFDTMVFGVPISVQYQIFYVNSYQDIKTLNIVNPGTLTDDNFIVTTLCYIKDQNKYIDYDGSTQHELQHLYQELMSGKDLLENPKIKNIYTTAIKLAKSTNAFEKFVGFTIYYGSKFEKDAFMNEMYKQIMDNWQINPFETIKKNVVYKNVNTIKNVIDNLTEYQKTKLQETVKFYFNKNLNWFITIANKIVKTYTNKIGKIIIKAQNDIVEKYPKITFNEKIQQNLP